MFTKAQIEVQPFGRSRGLVRKRFAFALCPGVDEILNPGLFLRFCFKGLSDLFHPLWRGFG